RPPARWPPRNRRPPWTGRWLPTGCTGLSTTAGGWPAPGSYWSRRSTRRVRWRRSCFARRTGRWPDGRYSAPATRPRHLCWPDGGRWNAAAGSRGRGPAMSRASGWLGAALQAQTAGQSRRLLTACRRGLEVLDEHRFTLGASELRAQATAHGAELATLAQRHAVRAHR